MGFFGGYQFDFGLGFAMVAGGWWLGSNGGGGGLGFLMGWWWRLGFFDSVADGIVVGCFCLGDPD